MEAHGRASGTFDAGLTKRRGMDERGRAAGRYHVVCRDPEGRVKWEEDITNLIVNEGLDHLLDATLSGATQITTWYLGLTDGTPTAAAGDTLASHAGWTEVTAYTGDRKAWTDGGVSSQSVDNSGSVASFAINSDSTTIGGAFLASAATGTSGTLYSVGAFSGDKSADSGDTLEVTFTGTMSDDGA